MKGVNLLLVLLLVASSTILDGLLLSSAVNSDILCNENEKTALIKFRQGFRNPSQSKIMSSWMLEENCCNWKGVECNYTTGHVISLDLHQQFLQGEFGTSLLGLPHLRHLDLSQNDFHEALFPEFICKFKYLEYLNLSSTNLTGAIPCDISKLQSLEAVDVSRNHLSSFLPSSMVKLIFLSAVNFSFNSLTGKIPMGGQFSTFDDSSFIGNPDLCGMPLSKSCWGHFREEDSLLDEESFYVSMVFGVITGFWAFWATLALKTSWRHAYMRYLNKMGTWIYVFVAIRLPNHKSA